MNCRSTPDCRSGSPSLRSCRSVTSSGESAEYRITPSFRKSGLRLMSAGVSLSRRPTSRRLAIELDGEPLAAIVSPPQKGRAQLTDFNFAHPLLASRSPAR